MKSYQELLSRERSHFPGKDEPNSLGPALGLAQVVDGPAKAETSSQPSY